MIVLYTPDNEPFAIGFNELQATHVAIAKQTALTRVTVQASNDGNTVQLTWNNGSVTLRIGKVDESPTLKFPQAT